MNSAERLHARLRGQPVDRPPNLDILMTFAALSVPLPARAESDLDPFYQARLDEGKALHLRGDIPGSIQSL